MSAGWRAVDGVLLFDKPLEMSSNFALQKVKRLFRAQKAGHTGTLDPLASGLLPVCLGEATKFAAGLLDADKSYLATLRLGQTTTTGDAEGEILTCQPVQVTLQQLEEVLQRLSGEISQFPPMHSALKHQGKPLYEYIRKGETVTRQARTVTIHDLRLEEFSGEMAVVSVHCSKGTYVRTLAEDIGKLLGCGAYLIGLRRTAISRFSLAEAHTLESLEEMSDEQRDACLLPVDTLVAEYPRLDVDDTQAGRLLQGQRLALDSGLPEGFLRLYGVDRFIGLGRLEGRRLSPYRMLSESGRD